jgi:hypothetical protein
VGEREKCSEFGVLCAYLALNYFRICACASLVRTGRLMLERASKERSLHFLDVKGLLVSKYTHRFIGIVKWDEDLGSECTLGF